MSEPTELPTFLDDDGPSEIPAFICRSEVTKQQRRQASNEAIASLALEGFTVPADALAASERYVNGEIGLSDLIKILYKQAGREDLA